MRHFALLNRLAAIVVCALSLSAAGAEHATPQSKSEPGTVQVPAFELPLSPMLSPQARQLLQRPPSEGSLVVCPSLLDPANLTIEHMKEVRACYAERDRPRLVKMQARYAVNIESRQIAGVPTEIFLPKEGVAAANKDRVLINLHGGSFMMGDAKPESIPIAAVGKIKVIGIDYRMGPEHQFPAASEDVAAVYKALLKDYVPANIGIYGCSSGGALTAQSLAWFQKAGLPLPGAVGLFCSGAGGGNGDSAYIGSAIVRINMRALPFRDVYFGENPDLSDPLLVPLASREVMSKFPPTLLLSATRDNALSNVVYTHAQLVKLNVPAQLHVWEGLGHCFLLDSEFPESRETYEVIVKFFDLHLGKAGLTSP